MSISDTLLGGRRHIRFTRTVRSEVDGSSIVADIWLEAYFPPDFQPERYSIDLVRAKDNGVVTVGMMPQMRLDDEVEVLNAGAHQVSIQNQPTATSFVDVAADFDARHTEERTAALKVQIAMLEARPDLAAGEKVTRARLLAGAAVKPLRRI